MPNRRLLGTATLLVAALLLGACGGGGSTASTPSSSSGAPTTTTAGAGPGTTAASGSTASANRPAKPSAGCGTSSTAALDKERRTVSVNGEERFYLLTTPPKHDGKTPVPLVVDFHGLAEGAQIHSAMSDYTPLAQAEGFAVAFPNGTGQPVRWDVNPAASNPDLAFFDTMLGQLEKDLCIDTSRVYATGLSFGAIMTSFLTCKRSDKLAAVAPVAGLMVPTPCDQSRKVPILTFHGTADPILKFNGGAGAIPGMTGPADAPTTTAPAADLNGAGYPTNVKNWAERYGCDATPTDNKVSEHVIRRVYKCPAGAEVEFVIVVDGGHAWPGSQFSKTIENVVGPTTFEVDATKESWKFFQNYQLP